MRICDFFFKHFFLNCVSFLKDKQNKASKIQNYDKKFRLTKFIFKKYCKFGFSSRSMKLVQIILDM